MSPQQHRPVRLPASKFPKLQKQAQYAKIQGAILRTKKNSKPKSR
jgi:hypothetical protein